MRYFLYFLETIFHPLFYIFLKILREVLNFAFVQILKRFCDWHIKAIHK